jgi:probable phosphoglycerate mutase
VARRLYLVRHGEQADVPGGGDHDAAPLSDLGRQQSRLLGQRLRGIEFTDIYHSPMRRAAETAELIGGFLPGVPVRYSPLLADAVPSAAEPATATPPVHWPAATAFVGRIDPDEIAAGSRQVAAALSSFARPSTGDERELLVTHNFVIAWFVRAAMDAPDWRWLGLNQYNCGLTVLSYRVDAPPALLCYNDVGHLPPQLRGTGLRPEQLM